MTDKEIIELARKTREAQKKYFKTRRFDELQASKVLERQLDKALDDYYNSNQQLMIQI